MYEIRGVVPEFGFCKGFVVILRKGCSVIGELESQILDPYVICYGICKKWGLRDFLKSGI